MSVLQPVKQQNAGQRVLRPEAEAWWLAVLGRGVKAAASCPLLLAGMPGLGSHGGPGGRDSLHMPFFCEYVFFFNSPKGLLELLLLQPIIPSHRVVLELVLVAHCAGGCLVSASVLDNHAINLLEKGCRVADLKSGGKVRKVRASFQRAADGVLQ